MTYEIDIEMGRSAHDIDTAQLHTALLKALHVEEVAGAILSVTLVDNPTIHRINSDHLQHDYPTDVISFPLDWRHPERNAPDSIPSGRAAGAWVEGEIVASVDYANAEAVRQAWDLQSELTLYAVHGMLHICGYDDCNPSEKQCMQARETAVFRALGYQTIPRRSDGEVSSTATDSSSRLLPPGHPQEPTE